MDVSIKAPARPKKRDKKNGSPVIFFLIFGTIWTAFSLFVLSMLVKDALTDRDDKAEVSAWKQAECTIIDEQIQWNRDDYKLALAFEYSPDGGATKRIGRNFRKLHGDYETGHYSKIFELRKQYKVGTKTTCSFDPASTGEGRAIIDPDYSDGIAPEKLGAFAFISVFIVIGLCFIIIPIVSRHRKKHAPKNVQQPAELIIKKESDSNRIAAGVIGLISAILLTVSLATIPGAIGKMSTLASAGGWVEAQATIVRSYVKSHTSHGRNGSSTTFKPYIAYRYMFNGEEFGNDTYRLFHNLSSSGYSAKAAIVAQYPVNSTCAIFVNPDDPRESAIIHPKLTVLSFFGAFAAPITFGAIGGLLFGLYRRIDKSNRETRQAMRRGDQSLYRRGQRIKGAFRYGTAIFLAIFATFWLSISGCGFAAHMSDVKAIKADGGSGMFGAFANLGTTLFLSLFIMIGFIVLVCAIVSFYRAATNPQIQFFLASDRILPGEPFKLRFRAVGNVRKLRHVQIMLTKSLRASVHCSKGDNQNFVPVYRRPLMETTDCRKIESGELEIVLDDNVQGKDGMSAIKEVMDEYGSPATYKNVTGYKWELSVQDKRGERKTSTLDTFELFRHLGA